MSVCILIYTYKYMCMHRYTHTNSLAHTRCIDIYNKKTKFMQTKDKNKGKNKKGSLAKGQKISTDNHLQLGDSQTQNLEMNKIKTTNLKIFTTKDT